MDPWEAATKGPSRSEVPRVKNLHLYLLKSGDVQRAPLRPPRVTTLLRGYTVRDRNRVK